MLEKRLDWVEWEGRGMRGCHDRGGSAGELREKTGKRNSESVARRRYMGGKKIKTVKNIMPTRTVLLKNRKKDKQNSNGNILSISWLNF